MVDQKKGAWLLENMTALQEEIAAIGEMLHARQLMLFPMT
jgi:hypothetical protein